MKKNRNGKSVKEGTGGGRKEPDPEDLENPEGKTR